MGELEEQMKEIEDQHEQDQESLRSEIVQLENTLQKYQEDLSLWIAKCRKLETELTHTREQLSSQKAVDHCHSTDKSTNPESIGCGNCTLETRCQCIDDVVQSMNDDTAVSSEHDHPASAQIGSNKRIKLEAADPNIMEIDFTAAFSKPAHNGMRPSHTSAGVLDPCGFCQDGTPCICAEMAAEQERHNATRPSSPVPCSRSGLRQSGQQYTPPPSEGDVATTSAPSGTTCASGPGTCAQCVTDPNSTLFCKSLAASRQNSGGSGCCGAQAAGGGCCQSSVPLPPRATRSRAAASQALKLPDPNIRSAVTLSCADAYTALSRHSAYNQASGDMASWMPKLHPNTTSAEGRPAMEIDAANIMAVLKDFDRRFGSSK